MNIDKLKQKILDLAIRGKLVPQDPNDEPASVLINKIREEKKKLVKQGKIKAEKEESYIYKGSDNCYYEKIGNKEYCINDEIPFDVPDNWIWCRLGTIFNIGSSKRVHKSDWKDNGIPFYRARDIELLNKNIFKSNLYISVEFYNKIKRTYGIPQINDILVTAVGSLGKTFIVKDNNPFYYKDGNIICFSNFSNINPHYIQILFESSFMNDQIYSYSKGTTVNTYTIIHANKTLIPIPPLKEQKEIINTLQKTLKQIEIVEKAKKDIANLTNSLKSKVLDNIFGENSSYKSYYEKEYTLNDLLPYEQPAKYIVKNTDYNDKYKTPVITPGKSFILGHTNEVDGIYKVKNKVIIFDDFTTASRLVNFNFKVKSSALKILKSSDEDKFNIEYLFYLLQTIKVINNTHKRYWISEYAPKKLKIHIFDEQIKIVKKINKIFSVLNCCD